MNQPITMPVGKPTPLPQKVYILMETIDKKLIPVAVYQSLSQAQKDKTSSGEIHGPVSLVLDKPTPPFVKFPYYD